MVDDQEIEREHQELQEEKRDRVTRAEGVAGTAIVGAGCLYYVLLPFSFVLVVILIIWIFGVFGN